LALLGDVVMKFLAAELVKAEGIPGEILDGNLTIACGEHAMRPTAAAAGRQGRHDHGGFPARFHGAAGRALLLNDSPAVKPSVTWALEIEYDGTPFMGWQRQKHGLAIQQVLEEAGAKLCNGVMPAAVASGRTDAGVHALGQIVQMELPRFPPTACARR
jgi:hypothetical protein